MYLTRLPPAAYTRMEGTRLVLRQHGILGTQGDALVDTNVAPSSTGRAFPPWTPATLGFFDPLRFAPELLEHPASRHDLRLSKCPQGKQISLVAGGEEILPRRTGPLQAENCRGCRFVRRTLALLTT